MYVRTRGVSPIVGTVLLIGIVGLLAVTVAAFSLSAAGGLSAEGPWNTDAPEATIEITASGSWAFVEHTGGEAIDGDRLTVRGADANPWAGETVQEGDRTRVQVSGEQVEVVWAAHGLEETLAETSLSP